jgi:hypothetical protein
VTIAPRHILRLVGGDAPPTGHEIWDDTRVTVSTGKAGTFDQRWRCLVSGRIVEARGGMVELGTALDPFPVTFLVPAESPM